MGCRAGDPAAVGFSPSSCGTEEMLASRGAIEVTEPSMVSKTGLDAGQLVSFFSFSFFLCVHFPRFPICLIFVATPAAVGTPPSTIVRYSLSY